MPKLVRGYALDALDLQAAGRPDGEPNVASFLDAVAAARWVEFPAVGLGRDLRLESEVLSGGALVHDQRVVHLMAFAPMTAPPVPRPHRRSVRILPLE